MLDTARKHEDPSSAIIHPWEELAQRHILYSLVPAEEEEMRIVALPAGQAVSLR